jgi:serine/threonine protein phosphatase 1
VWGDSVMSCYVVADVHGCYREFMQLLHRVKFDEKKDTLYILGDIIDRGPGSEEMFEWVYKRYGKSVHMCMGNHEQMFSEFVHYKECCVLEQKILKKYKQQELDISWVLTSNLEGNVKEDLLFYYNFIEQGKHLSYDKYGTIKQLMENGRNLKYLHKMRMFFEKLPYYFELVVNKREFYLVHSYISEPVEDCDKEKMIWSRAYPDGEAGILGKVIIFGHTPTTNYRYNGIGGVIVQKIDDTITVNIDCGCCWRYENSKLALLRLDDMKVFYSNIKKNTFVTAAI